MKLMYSEMVYEYKKALYKKRAFFLQKCEKLYNKKREKVRSK